MNIFVNFQHVNTKFDKVRFEWHGGEESDNRKYHWTKTLELKDVKSKTYTPNTSIKVFGTLMDDTQKTYTIENVNELSCVTMEGDVEKFYISKDIIRNVHETYDEDKDTARVYFYIKDGVDFGKLNEVTYFSSKSLPEELKETEFKDLRAENQSTAKVVGASGVISSNR